MFDRLFRIREQSQPVERIEPRVGNLADGEVFPSSDNVRMFELFQGLPTSSGAIVTEYTAMRVSAVYRCVALIAGALASLPLHIYRRNSDGDRERVDTSPLWWLLNEEPVGHYSAASFWEYIAWQFLLRGDGLAYIQRNRAGQPTGFYPLRRSQVIIRRDENPDPRQTRVLKYYITTEGGYFGVDQDDMLHFPGFGFDGTSSMSVIQWGARNSIGIAISGDDFAGRFFSQGAVPQFALTAPKAMTDKQQEALRASWEAKYQGQGPNGIPLILTEGLSVKELSLSMADAQLLESRKWQVADVARAFGVPLWLVGDTEKSTSWGTGIEQQGIGFVRYTLMTHARRISQEINRKLFKINRYFVEHDFNAFLRGDTKARAEYYKAALGGTQSPGWMTPNEVRHRENEPKIDGGDELFKPEPGMAAPPPGNDGAANSGAPDSTEQTDEATADA